MEKAVEGENIFYTIGEYTYSFQTTRTFGENIYSGKITLKDFDDDQSNLLIVIINFNKKTKQHDPK